MTTQPREAVWTRQTVKHPHGKTSRLWVDEDGTQYRVFKDGPSHPMNRLVVVDATEGTS